MKRNLLAEIDALRIELVELYWRGTGERTSTEPLSESEREDARNQALLWWGENKIRKIRTLKEQIAERQKLEEQNRRWLEAFVQIHPLVRKAKANRAGLLARQAAAVAARKRKAKQKRDERWYMLAVLQRESDRLRKKHPDMYIKEIRAKLRKFPSANERAVRAVKIAPRKSLPRP